MMPWTAVIGKPRLSLAAMQTRIFTRQPWQLATQMTPIQAGMHEIAMPRQDVPAQAACTGCSRLLPRRPNR
jgi:hypothetical protein